MIEALRDDPAAIRRIPKVLVHCTLPHSNPGKYCAVWKRSQNGVTIQIHPFVTEKGERMYPFGSFARLLLYWIAWEVMVTGERKIYLAKTFREFTRTFGIRTHGADRDRIMYQMLALFRSRIEFSQDTRADKKWRFLDFTIEGDLAWDESSVTGLRLKEDSYIIVGEVFASSIRNYPVPIDIRAIQGLRNSALAMDFYSWSTYQAFQIAHTGKKPEPRIFPWRQLMQQFGSDYRYPSEFKGKIPHILRLVHKVYPELMVEMLKEGLKVYPTRPAVLPKGETAA